MIPRVKLDHCVVHVTDWRARTISMARTWSRIIRRGNGFAYRFGETQLNLHGPGVDAVPVARDPVRPGNSDLCFVWPGPIADAAAHLEGCGVPVELGPWSATARWERGPVSIFAIPTAPCSNSSRITRNDDKILISGVSTGQERRRGGSLASAVQSRSVQVGTDAREHRAERLIGQDAGVRIVARAMIAIEQHDLVEYMLCAMREGRGGEAHPQRA